MTYQDDLIEALTQQISAMAAEYAAQTSQLMLLQQQLDDVRARLDGVLPTASSELSGPPDYLPFGTGDGVLWRVLQAADLPGELDKPLHISSSDAHIRLAEASSNPTAPAIGAEVNLYMKADKLVIQFTHGSGDTHYFTLDLAAHAAVWVYATSAP
jgi:hypothetical protein